MQKHENGVQHENKHETFLLLIAALIEDDDFQRFFKKSHMYT